MKKKTYTSTKTNTTVGKKIVDKETGTTSYSKKKTYSKDNTVKVKK